MVAGGRNSAKGNTIENEASGWSLARVRRSTVQEMENAIQGKQMQQQEEEQKSGVLNPRSLGGSMAKGMLLAGVSTPWNVV